MPAQVADVLTDDRDVLRDKARRTFHVDKARAASEAATTVQHLYAMLWSPGAVEAAALGHWTARGVGVAL